LFLGLSILPLMSPAAEPEPEVTVAPSVAEQGLQALVARQQELLATLAKADSPNFDKENVRMGLQQLSDDYDDFLKKNKDYAPGYAAYGVLLGKIDMRRQSAAMLLKANELFGKAAGAGQATTPAFVRTWALVKNQLGNYLAEEGKPFGGGHLFPRRDRADTERAALSLSTRDPADRSAG